MGKGGGNDYVWRDGKDEEKERGFGGGGAIGGGQQVVFVSL